MRRRRRAAPSRQCRIMSMPPYLHPTRRASTLALLLATAFCAGTAAYPAAAAGHTPRVSTTAAAGPALLGDGPSWHNETVDFTGAGFTYTDTASGFDPTGAAYYKQRLIRVGGPGKLHYSTTTSHS